MQVTLGALTVLSRRDVWINSLHVVCGALVLTTSLVITLRSWRVQFADRARSRLKPDTTSTARGAVRSQSGFSRTASRRAREGRARRRRRAVADRRRAPPSALADYVALTKPRLNFLVVATSAAGYYLGAPARPTSLPMAQAVAGTALVAGGAAVLNQVYERDTDALMRRTRMRPLPDGRVAPADARAVRPRARRRPGSRCSPRAPTCSPRRSRSRRSSSTWSSTRR